MVELRGSDRSTWVTMSFMVCLWIIWDGWAAFFLWLTQWSTLSNATILVDFSSMYGEGKRWLSGAYVNPQTHAFTYPFLYPPTWLPLFGFFAQFDFGIAALLWTRLGLVIFLIATLSMAVVIKPERKYLFVSIAALLFFTSYGVRIGLQLGEANLLLAGLAVLSLAAHRARHSRMSATLLAVGTLLNAPSALFLLYFVAFYRDMRYLLYFLESTVVILGLSLLAVPIQLYWVYMVNIFPTLFVGAPLPVNDSITGMVSFWGYGFLIPIVLAAVICAFAAVSYRVHPILFSKQGGTSSIAADGMFLMNSLVMLLLFTRGWPQDYVWVVLPVAFFVSELLSHGVKATYFVVVVLAAVLFNTDAYPLLSYFNYYYYYYPHIAMINYDYYFPVFATIPTGLIGSFLMAPALILFLVRPQAILQNKRDKPFPHNRLATS